MKTTLAKMIACLALTGTAVAMTASAETPQTDTHGNPTASAAVDRSIATMDVDDIEGKDIRDSSGAQLGDVDEVVKGKANQPMAVIGLEDSDREVAVPLSTLAMSSDGKSFTTRMTRAQLLDLPDYDPMDLESIDE